MKGAKPNLDNVTPMKSDMPLQVPPAPDHLSEMAVQVWDRLAPVLALRQRIEPAFEDLFAAYCESSADFVRLSIDLQDYGSYFETKTRNGVQEKHRAAWRQRQEALANMRQLSALFGLSPIDERRFSTSGQGDLLKDLLDKLDGPD